MTPSSNKAHRSRTSLRALLVALLGVGVLSACQPEPTPLTVDLVGDSITMQAHWNRDSEFRRAGVGLASKYDLVVDAWLGNKFQDVQKAESARVFDSKRPRPSVLVIALGLNNADPYYGGGGWTKEDETAFKKLLNTPHPSSCVVVVLPAAGNGAPQQYRDHAVFASARMKTFASQRPRTVMVDWAPVIKAHPEYLRADGKHLADNKLAKPDQMANPVPADAYASLIWSGVAKCPPPPSK